MTVISLLTVVFTAGNTVAHAADGGTIYPEDDEFIKTLELTSLTDYAVEGGLYAFADGKTVKVFNDGNYKEYAFENDVTDLAAENGEIYCGCSNGKVYTLDEQTCEYTFPQKVDELLFNGYYYFTDADGKLNVFDKSETVTYDGSYSNLKLYGETVYAVSGNELYAINGSQCEKVTLEYADYAVTREITVGRAATALKTYAPVTFVQISEGAFMTEVDLSRLDGEYFVPVKTIKTEQVSTALLLCYSGNAAIVSLSGKCYVVLKAKTSETEVEHVADKPFENAQMLGDNIYASPYVVSGTVSATGVISRTVKVLNKIVCEDVLDTVFYEVEYKTEDATLKGFVAEGFLSEKIIDDNKKPTEIPDPDFSESSDTKTILIIFAVVLLVLAAISYISYVSSGKRKKSKKKDKDKQE